jgi:hypothetical protein
MSFVIEEWVFILDAWMKPQVLMSEVVRWGSYLQTNGGASIRRQNTLQHTHSLWFMADLLLFKLSGYVQLDEVLIMRACHYHDVGESLCGFDVPYAFKNTEQDLNEYLAFCDLHSKLDEEFFMKTKKAFLLQFAGKDMAGFPDEALKIMELLNEQNRYEVLFFEALERLEYFFYPLEHCLDGKDHLVLLKSVVENQCPSLDRLADSLPGFKETMWTPEISAKFKSLL